METSSNISRQSPEEGTVTLPFGAQVEMNERATSRHDSVTMEKQLLPPTLKEPVRAVSPIGKHPQPRVPTPPTRNPETEPKPSPMLSNRASPNLGSSILKTRSTPVSFTGSSTDSLKTAGSMWITRYHDKYWPVVLCNEATVPPTFMKSRRETSHLPAILLGKRI